MPCTVSGSIFALFTSQLLKLWRRLISPNLLSVLDMDSGLLCCRLQLVGDEYGREGRFPSPSSHGRKHKVRFLCVRRVAKRAASVNAKINL
jgi:hypothetical protein